MSKSEVGPGRLFRLMRGLCVVFEFFFGFEELLASWANICSLRHSYHLGRVNVSEIYDLALSMRLSIPLGHVNHSNTS
jgi:hypothetical protein